MVELINANTFNSILVAIARGAALLFSPTQHGYDYQKRQLEEHHQHVLPRAMATIIKYYISIHTFGGEIFVISNISPWNVISQACWELP